MHFDYPFEKDFENIKSNLEKKPKTAILTHVSPDGDAIGSSLALHRILQYIQVPSFILYPDEIPDNLLWLFSPNDQYVIAPNDIDFIQSFLKKIELLFTVDLSVLERARPIHEWIPSDIPIICFDHHEDREPFAELNIWNPKATSTAELVFYFAYDLEQKGQLQFSSEIAYPLFVGLETDTGGFHFSTVNHITFLIASYLVKKGVKPEVVFFHLYQNESLKRLKFLGYVLTNCLFYLPQYRCAYLKIRSSDLKKWNITKKEIEGFVFYPLNLKDVDLGIVIREDEDGDIKMSFRSKGNFPANRIAHAFNGGGHFHAAGARITGKKIEEVEDQLIQILENCFKKIENYEETQI